MKSRWSQQGVADALGRWGDDCGEQLALRLYTARLIGADPGLVLHGGGNVSVKLRRRTAIGEDVDAVCIKASGSDLAHATPADLPAVAIDALRRLRTLNALEDDAMVNEVRRSLLDARGPRPSIEALLHVFLPHAYVDHSHADAVLALTNQEDGERTIRDALGDRVAVVPYVQPGFELAKVVDDAVNANPKVEGVVLLQHGLVTFGDDARTSYERHIALVDACERFIEKSLRGRVPTSVYRIDEKPDELTVRVAPMLRGLLAHETGCEDQPFARSILEWRSGDELMTVVNSREIEQIAATGPLTSDHLIRTKPRFMLVGNPRWDDPKALREQLAQEVESYRRDYSAYVTENGGSMDGVDPSPRVVILPGAGLLCWGRSKRDARIAADIAEHTIHTKMRATLIGSFVSLCDRHLFEMEYRGLQRAKLSADTVRPLTGQVVVISGGAGAIGAAIGRACADAGAHIAVTDVDGDRLAVAVERINADCGADAAMGVVMDVTDERSVVAGFDEVLRAFGGVDVVVPNAGVAHVASLDELDVADFRRVMDVNATGCLLFLREGARRLRSQHIGGNVIVISSKNVLGPGREFGAYSASKAAAHQLGRVATLELAEYGIRVNMITPDAVFGDAEVPSGLWREVGPDRAKKRNMKVDDLPEYYRRRNLLTTTVHARHVGNAVVFFASNLTPTTGAILPVDGGVVEALPR